jgi:hypothetical protein
MKWSAAARRTTLFSVLCLTVFSFTLFTGSAMGQGILGPGDTAIPIDVDSVFVAEIPPAPNGRYPAAENPAAALDGVNTTKYLNFGGNGSGFIVTPLVPLPVESFRITTANDALGRDPASWALYGRNGALTTVDSGPTPAINATGLAETWTLIAQGAVALPDARQTLGPIVDVNNVGAVSYQHLKMIFPTTKTANIGIMQIADIQLYADNGATTGQEILSATDAVKAVDEILAPAIPAQWGGPGGSSFPANEAAPNAVDAVHTTKYLNFGEEKSGLIITNTSGQVDVNFMKLRTANDAPERDPTSYELYGTNQAIQSVTNSTGNLGEVWTLISSGPLNPPTARFADYPVVAVNSPANYQSYKLIFPTVRNATAANSLQIADVQFSTLASQIPEPTTTALVALGLACVAALRRRMM